MKLISRVAAALQAAAAFLTAKLLPLAAFLKKLPAIVRGKSE